jgi:hypothetical protein
VQPQLTSVKKIYLLVEVGELLEVGVLAPHGLGDHLGQLHGSDGGGEPAVAGQHVHAGLYQPDRLGQDDLRVLLQFRATRNEHINTS